MKILLIDNYDSFTHNLVHYLEAQDATVTVVRNDEINFEEVLQFEKIVLSPGPGLPKDAGLQPKLIELIAKKKPILGVCLGFQALTEYFGGEIFNQATVKHGIAENCSIISTSKLFANIHEPFKVGLYHSWAAKRESFPKELIITAESDNKTIMAFEHQYLPLAGVQFHPESVLTENGHEIIKNFLKRFN